MPQVFKIGPYWVYFWANESDPLEPVHVHVSERAVCQRDKGVDHKGWEVPAVQQQLPNSGAGAAKYSAHHRGPERRSD